MSVLEAWANRLAVFMTPACNLPEGIAAGAAFEITTSPEQMAAVLAARLADECALGVAGQAGSALVEQKYTWDRVVTDMRQLYGWTLGRCEKPAFVHEN